MDEMEAALSVADGDEAWFPFDLLPPELQTHIFLALDLPSLAAAMQVSSTWRAMIEEPVMWKLKCLRDFPHYLEGAPLPEPDCIVPDEKNYKQTLDELEDAVSHGNEQALLRLVALIHRFTQITDAETEGVESTGDADGGNDSAPLLETSTAKAVENNKAEDKDPHSGEEAPKQEVRDWKQFYRQCLKCPNLDGRWIGEYGSHGKELVHIAHRGYRVLATKMTGDANVPAGKPTFRMTMTAGGDKGKGQMHLADTGYTRPRWGRAYLEVEDVDNLVVKWFYGVHPSQHFDTYYERVKESGVTSEPALEPHQTREGEEEAKDIKEEEESDAHRTQERDAARDDSAATGDEEERERKRAKREVTVSGFTFHLVRSRLTGQLHVEEVEDELRNRADSDSPQELNDDHDEDDRDDDGDFYEELAAHGGEEEQAGQNDAGMEEERDITQVEEDNDRQ